MYMHITGLPKASKGILLLAVLAIFVCIIEAAIALPMHGGVKVRS
jgi:hypothetical protein